MFVVALVIWASTLVISVLGTVYVCSKIEKTGVKRWGATGKLFRYE